MLRARLEIAVLSQFTCLADRRTALRSRIPRCIQCSAVIVCSAVKTAKFKYEEANVAAVIQPTVTLRIKRYGKDYSTFRICALYTVREKDTLSVSATAVSDIFTQVRVNFTRKQKVFVAFTSCAAESAEWADTNHVCGYNDVPVTDGVVRVDGEIWLFW